MFWYVAFFLMFSLLLTAAMQIAKFIFLWDVNVMMNIKAKLEHLLLLMSLFCCAA